MLTANLAVKSPGAGVPTGTVVFAESMTNQVLATVQFTGASATASVPAGIGPKTIIALYRGDNRFMDSSSASAGHFSVLNAASYREHGPRARSDGHRVHTRVDQPRPSRRQALPLPATLGGVSVILTDSAGSLHHAAADLCLFDTTLAFSCRRTRRPVPLRSESSALEVSPCPRPSASDRCPLESSPRPPTDKVWRRRRYSASTPMDRKSSGKRCRLRFRQPDLVRAPDRSKFAGR